MQVDADRSGRTFRRGAALVAAVVGLVCLWLLFAPAARPTVAAAPLRQDPATPEPLLDVSSAQPLVCGGYYSGTTAGRANNVSAYGCRPWWDERGGEAVYRLELQSSQSVTVTLLDAAADLDLFLLRFAYPSSCLAAGDHYLTYQGQPGVYFLSVDGYGGASSSYAFRVDCPDDQQATPTPTFTPSPTPTATATGTVTATPSASPAPASRRLYLPLMTRGAASALGPTVTFTLQDGINGYAGATDTTLDSWEPSTPQGSDNRLRLFYGRPPKPETQMAPVVRFDLSLLPPAAQVQAATLRLYVRDTPLHDIRARAQGLLRAWDEASATWEEARPGAPWDEPGALGAETDRTAWASEWQRIIEGGRWYEFDILPLAREWAQRPQSNHGVVLAAGPGDDNASVQALFVSREGNASQRPQLVISYALPQ